MKKPLALTFCLLSGCLLLAGCTDADWDHVMSFGPQDTDTVQADAPQHTASQFPDAAPPATLAANPSSEPANAGFCRSVAAQDATGNDFDPATQRRVYARSYAQCVSMYTR
jgi:hypothetical protein